LKKQWCIPPLSDAAFVAAMENILDLYCLPYNELFPVVCMDEKPYQLLDDVLTPIPMKPGSPKRFDYEYKRRGTCSIFVFNEPLTGWTYANARQRRTAIDFAHEIKELLTVHFPKAIKIRLASDNLNTHVPASLYKAFPAKEARELLRRIEFHYTPKHGSWLNMAEISISILARQCLDRRIPDLDMLNIEISAWCRKQNSIRAPINWQFTTDDARIKLRRLYPHI
jgi:hypothetical protein